MIFRWRNKPHGFTIVEMVIVMAILGVIAVVASPIFQSLPATRAEYAVEKIRADFLYAQGLAMQTQNRTRISASPSLQNYQIEIEASPGSWQSATDPSSRSAFSVQLNAGDFEGVEITQVTDTGAGSGNMVIIYDEWGRPLDASEVPISAEAVLELNGTWTVAVQPETGFVLKS